MVGSSGEGGGVHHRDATNGENIHPNHKVQARHNQKERVEDNGVTKKREREGDDEETIEIVHERKVKWSREEVQELTREQGRATEQFREREGEQHRQWEHRTVSESTEIESESSSEIASESVLEIVSKTASDSAGK